MSEKAAFYQETIHIDERKNSDGRGSYHLHLHALIIFLRLSGWRTPSCRPSTRRTSSSSPPARTATRSSAETSFKRRNHDHNNNPRIIGSSFLLSVRRLREQLVLGSVKIMDSQCPRGSPRGSLPERERRRRQNAPWKNAPGTGREMEERQTDLVDPVRRTPLSTTNSHSHSQMSPL